MSSFIKKVISASLLASVGACSSPPKIAMPDGTTRLIVNAPSLDGHEYEIDKSQESMMLQYDRAVSQKFEILHTQIAQLQAYIRSIVGDDPDGKMEQPITAKRGTSLIEIKAVPISRAPLHLKKAVDLSASKSAGAIEISADSVTFRVTQAFGTVDFKPSPEIGDRLLAAARDGKTIEIRGRTDATQINPVDTDIALKRATNARMYLVNHDVPAAKIRVTYLSANGFIADNSTAAGKALNRRVELEVKGLQTHAYKTEAGALVAAAP